MASQGRPRATVATDPDGGVMVTNILESSDAYRRGSPFFGGLFLDAHDLTANAQRQRAVQRTVIG